MLYYYAEFGIDGSDKQAFLSKKRRDEAVRKHKGQILKSSNLTTSKKKELINELLDRRLGKIGPKSHSPQVQQDRHSTKPQEMHQLLYANQISLQQARIRLREGYCVIVAPNQQSHYGFILNPNSLLSTESLIRMGCHLSRESYPNAEPLFYFLDIQCPKRISCTKVEIKQGTLVMPIIEQTILV